MYPDPNLKFLAQFLSYGYVTGVGAGVVLSKHLIVFVRKEYLYNL